MPLPMIGDEGVEIDILAAGRGQSRIERLRGFAARPTLFMVGQRALDDLRARTTFAPRQAMSKRAGAAIRKRRFGHRHPLNDRTPAGKPSHRALPAFDAIYRIGTAGLARGLGIERSKYIRTSSSYLKTK